MEEVPDEIPDLEPAQEYEELEETIPEPPPLKRASKLTEKVTCEGCGKTLSLHAYRYSGRSFNMTDALLPIDGSMYSISNVWCTQLHQFKHLVGLS